MKDAIAMVLGRSWWWRGADGWHQEACPAGNGPTLEQRFAAWAAAQAGAPLRLIYEPEGLAHQGVEMPRVGRAAFATLERIRRDFPAVASEALGWGIEPPAVGAGGAFSSLLHFELTPLLLRLVDRPAGPTLRAAWSAFTVAVADGASRAPEATQTVLFVLPDFVALAQAGGAKRAFKAWCSPTDRDWKVVGLMLGETDEAGGVRPDPSGRRGRVTVVAHEGSGRCCPFWEALRQSGRIDRELTLDDVALRAARLAPRHPANLVAAFPRPLNLDRTLAAATLVAASVVALMVVATLAEQRRQQLLLPAARAQLADQQRTLAALRRNEAEMKALQAEAFGPAPLPPLDRAAALRNLAAVLPDAATLTRLRIGPGEQFEFSAAVAGADFDAAHLPALLAGSGFTVGPGSGLAYDRSKGLVEVHGQLGGRP